MLLNSSLCLHAYHHVLHLHLGLVQPSLNDAPDLPLKAGVAVELRVKLVEWI